MDSNRAWVMLRMFYTSDGQGVPRFVKRSICEEAARLGNLPLLKYVHQHGALLNNSASNASINSSFFGWGLTSSFEVWSDAFRRSGVFLLFCLISIIILEFFVTVRDIAYFFVIIGHLVCLSFLLLDVSQFALVAVLARACL
jgi:hypothetical protein